MITSHGRASVDCNLADDRLHATPMHLLVRAKQAAAACGVSLRSWRSWDSSGRIPRPIRIGRSTFWRVEELQQWTTAGCPRRAEWEAIK